MSLRCPWCTGNLHLVDADMVVSTETKELPIVIVKARVFRCEVCYKEIVTKSMCEQISGVVAKIMRDPEKAEKREIVVVDVGGRRSQEAMQ